MTLYNTMYPRYRKRKKLGTRTGIAYKRQYYIQGMCKSKTSSWHKKKQTNKQQKKKQVAGTKTKYKSGF